MRSIAASVVALAVVSVALAQCPGGVCPPVGGYGFSPSWSPAPASYGYSNGYSNGYSYGNGGYPRAIMPESRYYDEVPYAPPSWSPRPYYPAPAQAYYAPQYSYGGCNGSGRREYTYSYNGSYRSR